MSANVEKETELADHIKTLSNLTDARSETVSTTLSTDQRVIARVTDGIYRKPGSALRELISNAYDADATRVVVETDAPRFSRISVEDDGRGMTPEEVAHLLKSIGGSAKRTAEGQELGLAQEGDQTLSPGGRKLIGKLGIGLFSVSQLTRRFQIITKVAGDSSKTIAEVTLHQFSDKVPGEDSEAEFEAGRALVWREGAADENEHGTTIVLTSIRPQIQKVLRSAEIWDAIDNPVGEADVERHKPPVPTFHIGRSNAEDDYITEGVDQPTSLPWDPENDDPTEAFQKLVDSVWNFADRSDPNATLERLFDNYLQMLWELGLSLPVNYVYGHLFDEPASDDWATFFRLSNDLGGHAEQLEGAEGAKVRDLLDLTDGRDQGTEFRVYLDDVEVLRPIRFRGLPATTHKLTDPLVFLGKVDEDFEGFPIEVSAGPLSFEAYLFWTPKVAPRDHRGALVRIHDSSGSLFDHTFFRYQVSEQTRLQQIVCEVFVSEGLESALNIDRESFNASHPHMALLIRWIHSALRQLATAQKRLAQEARKAAQADEQAAAQSAISKIVSEANESRTGGEGVVPDIAFVDTVDEQPVAEAHEVRNVQHRFETPSILEGLSRQQSQKHEETLRAIAQVLSIYGVFDDLSPSEQSDLLTSLSDILKTSGGL